MYQAPSPTRSRRHGVRPRPWLSARPRAAISRPCRWALTDPDERRTALTELGDALSNAGLGREAADAYLEASGLSTGDVHLELPEQGSESIPARRPFARRRESVRGRAAAGGYPRAGAPLVAAASNCHRANPAARLQATCPDALRSRLPARLFGNGHLCGGGRWFQHGGPASQRVLLDPVRQAGIEAWRTAPPVPRARGRSHAAVSHARAAPPPAGSRSCSRRRASWPSALTTRTRARSSW